ncbi:hypothetical protein SUDANB23_06099 [Streptomyces sp. enrichment culture]
MSCRCATSPRPYGLLPGERPGPLQRLRSPTGGRHAVTARSTSPAGRLRPTRRLYRRRTGVVAARRSVSCGCLGSRPRRRPSEPQPPSAEARRRSTEPVRAGEEVTSAQARLGDGAVQRAGCGAGERFIGCDGWLGQWGRGGQCDARGVDGPRTATAWTALRRPISGSRGIAEEPDPRAAHSSHATGLSPPTPASPPATSPPTPGPPPDPQHQPRRTAVRTDLVLGPRGDRRIVRLAGQAPPWCDGRGWEGEGDDPTSSGAQKWSGSGISSSVG